MRQRNEYRDRRQQDERREHPCRCLAQIAAATAQDEDEAGHGASKRARSHRQFRTENAGDNQRQAQCPACAHRKHDRAGAECNQEIIRIGPARDDVLPRIRQCHDQQRARHECAAKAVQLRCRTGNQHCHHCGVQHLADFAHRHIVVLHIADAQLQPAQGLAPQHHVLVVQRQPECRRKRVREHGLRHHRDDADPFVVERHLGRKRDNDGRAHRDQHNENARSHAPEPAFRGAIRACRFHAAAFRATAPLTRSRSSRSRAVKTSTNPHCCNSPRAAMP